MCVHGWCNTIHATSGNQENHYVNVRRLLAAALFLFAGTTQANDFWDELADHYGIGSHDHEDVRYWSDDFASRPHEIRTLVRRAEPYLAVIARQLETASMPAELICIPFLESGFDPNAFSSGTAAGLWQFMPHTADRFGIQRSWWYDGRRDIIASTEAAIRYLAYLHDIYDDWLLTLAAYNAGEGRVRRAITRNRKAGRPTDFWSLDLPPQTEAYVPRILGLAEIFARPDAFNVTLPALSTVPQTIAVKLPGQLGLPQAAKLADMPLTEVQRLNPAFNSFATDPDGPHRLLLPADKAGAFALALKALPASERVSWSRHKVQAGDTLGELAEDFDTTVSVIRSINKLSGNQIRIGQVLMIPSGANSAIASLPASQQTAGARIYKVRMGDSLWSIARRHDIHVADLTRWNRMSSRSVIRPGQVLLVTSPSRTERTVYYTVRSGDSLGGIARRYRVRANDIAAMNDLATPDRLRPGQRLKIRVDVADHSGV